MLVLAHNICKNKKLLNIELIHEPFRMPVCLGMEAMKASQLTDW